MINIIFLGWLPNLFATVEAEPPTLQIPATQKPFIPFLPPTDPLQKPETWVSMFLHHIGTTTKKPIVKPTDNPLIPKKKYYNNYQLWRVFPKSEDDVKYLEDYRLSPEGTKLQWLKGPCLKGMNDILIPPNMVQTFKEYLQDEDIAHEMILYDLGRAILYENPKLTRREQIETELLQGHPLTWYRYHRFTDISKFLNYLQRKNPRNVELVYIGRSFEGRPLTVAKISSGYSSENVRRRKKYKRRSKKWKPAVFIEAGSHGREWIGPSVATWILNVLINGIGKNGNV